MKSKVKSPVRKPSGIARQPVRSGKAHAATRGAIVSHKRIQRVVDRWVETLDPQMIVLFGSYAYGNPGADSDVDVLIVVESRERPVARSVRALQAVRDVKDFPMDIMVRTPQEIRERLRRGDLFMQDVLKRGKIMYERGSL